VSAVLDSSAVLALLCAEPGADKVAALLPDALLSSVNLAEVVGKLCERGMPLREAREAIEGLGAKSIEFGIDQAYVVAELRTATRSRGLSLGDRACLALARLHDLPAVTADAAWLGLGGFEIVLIRGESC
jgi:ribonuclease VapC